MITAKHQANRALYKRLALLCFSNDFPFPYLSCSCMSSCWVWGEGVAAVQGFGMGGLTEAGKSLITFLHYWWVFFTPLLIKVTLFLDLQIVQGKSAWGCLPTMCHGMGSFLSNWKANGYSAACAAELDRCPAAHHRQSHHMSCMLLNNVTCTLCCIAFGCHSFPAPGSRWKLMLSHIWAPLRALDNSKGDGTKSPWQVTLRSRAAGS